MESKNRKEENMKRMCENQKAGFPAGHLDDFCIKKDVNKYRARGQNERTGGGAWGCQVFSCLLMHNGLKL